MPSENCASRCERSSAEVQPINSKVAPDLQALEASKAFLARFLSCLVRRYRGSTANRFRVYSTEAALCRSLFFSFQSRFAAILSGCLPLARSLALMVSIFRLREAVWLAFRFGVPLRFLSLNRAHSMQVELEVCRSATCPFLQGSPVKYRLSPLACASCLLMISMSLVRWHLCRMNRVYPLVGALSRVKLLQAVPCSNSSLLPSLGKQSNCIEPCRLLCWNPSPSA